MMLSMTGYGKTVCELPTRQVTIEIKSLNSKQLDIYTRLPNLYKEKELELRNLISKYLIRGKVEFNITYETTDASSNARINFPLVKEYYAQLKGLTEELGAENDDALMQIIMRFPDALMAEKEELSDQEWSVIQTKIEEALLKMIEFRKREGQALRNDILMRIDTILELQEKIKPLEKDRIERIKEKLNSSLGIIQDQEKIDSNRYEQELIYYLEKIDITEEEVRLSNHCKFFKEVSEEKDPSGKKLSFISQEIGREINTLGSKANHSDIQRLVVMMKDELEKIKEQLMNVL
ncbi:MAG: YicC family protein [Bacteroidales bacterium]|nr:YicC family protein [Bacteroidales bacterium]